MKIGLLHFSVLPPKNYGGIERIVMTLAKEYTRLGHEVVIFCKTGSQIDQYESVTLPESKWNETNLKPLMQQKVDFIHSHEPLPFDPGIPFLITIHGNGHPEEKYFPNTNFLSQSHARNHNAKYFIFNGVDPEHYPFTTKKDDYFVFLARTTWRVKNVKTAIAWANDLGVRLEIMGGDGISRGKICYRGLVDEPEKIELLKNAQALIYPTNWDEPCAAAPLEALACGTPVISSVNGCMPELVRPGTGVLCKNYDELLRAPEKLKSVSFADCRKGIEDFFSLKRMASEYLALIQRIIEKGPLDHQPGYNLKPENQVWLYKPTFRNKIEFQLRGKI